tara:strand:- start:85 stop:525 length:441 start_codon:yes stop_codon:yes gene_type:complete
MDLEPEHHVMRHTKKRCTLKDEHGSIVKLLPQAFELRTKDGENEKNLSVNWIEYFNGVAFEQNIRQTIIDFRAYYTPNKSSVFALATVRKVLEASQKLGHNKIKIVHDGKKTSHSSIKHMPFNDHDLMTLYASAAFTDIRMNTDYS